jgi:hypothetical protein
MRRADEVLLVIIIMDIYPLQNIAHAQSSLNPSFIHVHGRFFSVVCIMMVG